MNFSKLKIAAVALGGSLLFAATSASAGIAGSRHDFSAGGEAQLDNSSGEICVFCHTPHGADTNIAAPLWNKPTGTAGDYTVYSSTTLDGSINVGSVSLACLSCHDGQQAMDSMINAPGSGGYVAAGARFGTSTARNGGDATDGFINGDPSAPNNTNTGSLTTTGRIANLGVDLSNDHPVSIQYAGGGCTATQAADCGKGQFTDKDFNTAQWTQVASGTDVWWVDTSVGTAGTREKTDMILYTRSDVTAETEPTVECASCHDPHNASSLSASSPQFMRIENTNSRVCLACHDK